MKTILIVITISLVIGGFIGWNLRPQPEPLKPDTLIEFRYITKQDTLVIPKFKTVIKKDTLRFRDTVFIHQETNYIAEVDTAYEDSSLTANVQFVSPIPLSPKSYFNLGFKVREKTITNTIIQEEEPGVFYKRFITYLGFGVSYGLDSKKIEPAFQLGIGVRLN